MSALNACLQVARLAEAAADSVPYLESMAKVAVLVFRLLDVRFTILRRTDVVADSAFYSKRRRTRKVPRNSESIANTILVINDLVRMQGERESSGYIDICRETEGYLQGMAQDLKDIKRKHHGIKGIFSVDDYWDAIQAYRRRIDDLKTDFLIHSVGDCRLKVTQMHYLLKNAMAPAVVRHSEDFVFRIPKKHVAITAFFFNPALMCFRMCCRLYL
ncbi:hypothetical protein ARMGADRAFT_1088460 [Armillaria gallica]|uniref:Uncharacterized protein n=1 Tax=Armillaria gallica TaxID=47427 RepID=A0A2H3CSN7_ARMGA|nr:hypothetical protein ARMGADRAFT_1088460 [Armillaria gallica]